MGSLFSQSLDTRRCCTDARVPSDIDRLYVESVAMNLETEAIQKGYVHD